MSQSASHSSSSTAASASLRLVVQFVQVGFPPDAANLARFRVPPRWSPDEMRIRTLQQQQQQQQQQTQALSQMQTQINSPASTVFLAGPGPSEPPSIGLSMPIQGGDASSASGSKNALGLAVSLSSAHLRHSTASTTADAVRLRSSSSNGASSAANDATIRIRKPTAVDPWTVPLPDSPPAPPSITLQDVPPEPMLVIPPAPLPPWTAPKSTSYASLTGAGNGNDAGYATTTRELAAGQLTPTPARLLSASDARASTSQWALHQRRVTAGTMSSSMSRSVATTGNNYVKEKPPHPVEYRYKAQIIDSFPRVGAGGGKKNDGWLNHLPLFVFPDHMSIKESPTSPPPTTCHSFVLTKEDGTKLHCTSLTFWEKPTGQLGATLKYQARAWYVRNINESDLEYLTHLKSQIHALKSQLARDDLLDADERHVVEDRLKLFTDLMKPYVTNACVDTDTLWVPRALVLMSPWPVYDLMEDWLKCTFRGVMDANGTTLALEACLVNVINEVPMPPPGRREIAIRAHSSDLFFARPAPNEITALKNISFYPLFRTLPVESVVFLLECLLNEKRVLLVSEFPGLLNNAIQSLLLLMFPFNWFHVLISVLPIDLIGYLEAPVPFLIGLLSAHLPLVNPEILADDLVLVNLDTGTLTNTLRTPPTPLPARRRGKFVGRLKASCLLDPGIGAGPPLAITEAFPLGKLQTRTGTSLLTTPMALRDRLGASDPDLFAHHHQLVNAFGGPTQSASGSSVLRSPDSVSSSEISIQPLPPPVPIYPAGQSPTSRAAPSVISVATTTSLASRFSLFRRGSNASATASSVGSGSTMLPSPASSHGRGDGGAGGHQQAGGGFLLVSQTHKVIIEGHSFSADGSGPLSLHHAPSSPHYHPPHAPPSNPPAPRRWPASASSRCAECDAPDTPAKPLSRCSNCGLVIHMDCARTSLVAWCPRALDEPRIRRAALKLWVSIMRGYRAYLTRAGGDSGGVGIHLVRWVNEGTDADARAFMKMFVDTQAFSMFVQDRTGGVDGGGGGGLGGAGTADAEIIFFDEAIKAKRGRLARTVVRSGSDNAFFKDLSFAVTSVYRCPSPHQGDHVQVHTSFPLTSDTTFAATPIRKCDSLITPQEELMLTLYTAKMIRQAKRYAAAAAATVSAPPTPIAGTNGVGRPNTASTTSTSNSPTTPMGEWWRRINAVTSAPSLLPSPMSADIVDQHRQDQESPNDDGLGTAAATPGGLLDMLLPRLGPGMDMETPDQSRARVDDFLNRAWDTLKDPVFGQPLRSRDDYALRHAKLSEIGHGLNTLLLTCQQADLDDIILITSQIDKMVACLEDEFRDLFVDEGMLNRLLAGKAAGEGAPKLEWTSPSVDLSDLDVLKCVSSSVAGGLNGVAAGESGTGGARRPGV